MRTCFAGHSHHALLLLPEADVVLERQEVKEELEQQNKAGQIFRSLNCSITVSRGVMLGGKTDVEGSHEEGESQEVQVGVHKDSLNLIGVLLCETCDKDTCDQRARSGG